MFAVPLGACGGGGGTNSTPPPPVSAPPPTPAPTPAPPPPPPPPPPTTVNFDTAEFRRSEGPVYHNAISAYQRGATGAGVTLGVIDSGVDLESAEFAGRISPLSADLTTSGRSVDDEDGHGTAVSAIALAAKNDSGMHGVAFNATLLALRADNPGSCATEDPDKEDSGCKFGDSAIAAGLDRAIQARARVVNISLGGGGVGAGLSAAINRAIAAGIVIVIAAGNDGASTDPADNPSNPDAFARGFGDRAQGHVIIAGSVDNDTTISTFSNRAGTYAPQYLSALGRRVRAFDETGQAFLYSGTSFSAPQIAGAVALLAQAFPNLTGAQIVDILFRSARDVGDPGTDAIFGRGVLDIARAFQPSGTSALAGSQIKLPTSGDTGSKSGPMGDATGGTSSSGAIILDEYGRAFALDLGQTVAGARPELRLAPAFALGQRQVVAASPTMSIALSLAPANAAFYRTQTLGSVDAEQARVLAGSVIARVSPKLQVGFGIRRGSQGLAAAVEGHSEPAFLVGESARGQTGFALGADGGVALRHVLGKFNLTARAESGRALLRHARPTEELRLTRPDDRYQIAGGSVDRRFGPVTARLGIDMLTEEATVLGAKFGPVYGGKGARSVFVDAGASTKLGAGWSLGAQWRQGWTWADTGGRIAGGSLLKSNAWSLDASKSGVFTGNDSLSFRLAQPLRVATGGLNLNLPVDYDYATLTPQYGLRTLNLAPEGREIDAEAAWRVPLGAGTVTTNAFYRKDPGNIAAMPDDIGAAIRFTLGF